MGRITAVTPTGEPTGKVLGYQTLFLYHSEVLVCLLQEVQFANVEDNEL
jgi:hypothetical protein